MDKSEATNVVVWSEETEIGPVYPNGINATIAEALNASERIVARTASIEDSGQGMAKDDLAWADVVVWWGHRRHDDVTSTTVERVVDAVRNDGVGFVALHSAQWSKPFTTLLETSGDLGDVRTVGGETERLSVETPDHPIARGIDRFALPQVEMYGEPFDVPDPDTVVFESGFSEGGSFRSGCCWEVYAGKVFYFRPGHETSRIYHDHNVQAVLLNAVFWAAG